MAKYDLLVYLGLGAVLIAVGIAAFILRKASDSVEIETRKIRFAAATFTGILMLFIFTAILYFVDPQGPGKEIFDKAVSVMAPLTGVIIGYFFASKVGT